MAKLGINIDHIATLRQARRENEPEPISAALICERAGADSIIAHLREDRRHINDQDVRKLRKIVQTRFNLEMSINEEIVKIAVRVKPDQATLVPERRQEITTEGGLDVVRNFSRIQKVIEKLFQKKIAVSLFIDPVETQLRKAKELGVNMVEFHTGSYAKAKAHKSVDKEYRQIKKMSQCAQEMGLTVNAGHGLNYTNAQAIALIPGMEELNIGHSIISRALFVGLENAVREMVQLVKRKF